MTTYTETHEFGGPKATSWNARPFSGKDFSDISVYVMCVHVYVCEREKEMGWRWGGLTERKLAHFNMFDISLEDRILSHTTGERW